MKVLMVAPVVGLTSTLGLFYDMKASVIALSDPSTIVEIDVVGRAGGVLQDMGAKCRRFVVTGQWIYDAPPQDMIASTVLKGVAWNWIRQLEFQVLKSTRMPVVLICDLAPFTIVLIEDLQLRERGGYPNMIEYSLRLVELSRDLSIIGAVGGSFASPMAIKLLASLGRAGVSAKTRSFGEFGR